MNLSFPDGPTRSGGIFSFLRRRFIFPQIVLLSWMAAGHILAAAPGVVISEFMAINNATLKDEDGNYSDWLELYNTTASSVDLTGWYLSNNATNLTQWQFPSTNIASHSFLVVFASNKDRRIAGAPLHASFKLSGSGEYLALILPDGVSKVSEFAPAFPAQVADISYGYAMTSDPVLVLLAPPTFLSRPTPGSRNPGSGSSVVPLPVTFWPPAGVYTNNVLTVSLASSSPQQIIHYTLDGSVPTLSSRIYTNTLSLPSNTTVRARAESGGLLGQVTAANYFLLSPTYTNFNSNLPLVIIDTLGRTIVDGTKIGAYAIVIPTNSMTGRASLLSPADYTGRLGIGLHGSSSLGFPKQPFAIELDDENESSVEYPLLSFPPGNDWLLYPSYDDKTFMNNVLTEEIFRAMGHYAVRCQYTELFLRSTRGKLNASDYKGIYILIERIRIDPNRVNITDLDPTDNAPPAVTGGYIISKDKINDATDLLITTGSGEQLVVNRPQSEVITSEQYSYISDYVNQLEAALYGSNWRDPQTGYAAYLDSDSLVDYHWMVEYPKNIDGVRISNYMTKDRGAKLKMEPIWDWDLSWGNANYADGGHTNGWYYPQMSEYDDIWLHKLRTDPDFYQKIIDRWGALRLSVFNATNLLSRVDQLTNYLGEAQRRDFAVWPRLGTYVWPNPNGAAGGWDVDYVSPTTYSGIIAQFQKFILGRYLWIDQQFVPAPLITSISSTFSMTAPLGTLYYTLDGTDPRASGGAPSSLARPYAGSFTLATNAAILARAYYTNAWSAPARTLYVSELPTLRITEINYHPVAPSADSPYNDKDFEFVEVENTGSNAINLAGVSLGGGIDYTFAPNQLSQVGVTSNSFEGGGTPFTAATLGALPPPQLTNEYPGPLLRLLDSGTNLARNRIAFDMTATGACDRVTVDFDFRAVTSAIAAPGGTPTIQNFDTVGTAYVTAQRGTAPPLVHAPDAASDSSFLRLVPSSGNQAGVVAFDATSTESFNSIIATFDFRITPPQGGLAADGLGFALLNTARYGSSGAAPFFSEEPNLSGSLGIGFDDYNNASTPQEPNNNHVSLHWNAVQVGNAVMPSFFMADGKFHRAQILVLFTGNDAYVTVRLIRDIYGVGGPSETVLQNALVSGATPYQCRAAFGARTGGAWAAHDVDNVDIEFSQSSVATAGLSLLLLPTAQFGTTGVGTSLSTFADWPSVANTLAMDLVFNPADTFNDVSLYWNHALAGTTTVSPADLNLNAGVFHHVNLQFEAKNGGVIATSVLTPNSLGEAGKPMVVFTNLFIPGATIPQSRLEFSGRNGALLSQVDLKNVRAKTERWLPVILDPGASVVIVHNRAAFDSRYGPDLPVAGEFTGSLGNGGDLLTLSGSFGEPILDFSYDPAWYPITDGGGFSLVAVDANASPTEWGFANNWRPSSQPAGSPGVSDGLQQLPHVSIDYDRVADRITLSWIANTNDFDLFSTVSLSPPVQWNIVTNISSFSGQRWGVVLPVMNRVCFYRLEKSQ